MTTTSAHSQPAWWKSKRSKLTGFVALALAVIGFLAWLFIFHPYVSTDDARVAATLIRVAPEAISGRVIKMAVQEGDHVKKGDVLVELDHRIVDAQLQRAQARATLTSQELHRINELVAQKGLAARELDTAKANADTAQAELKLATVSQQNTNIKSPVDGIVIQKSTEEGNFVEPGQTVVTVADVDHAWIAANIEETAVGLVKIGQPVQINIDEGGTLQGKVSEIRSSVASQFALIPSDNGAGNFTKVVQRVPIKIEVDAHPGRILRAGQSVEVKIKVH
jgi:membrane fusion protein (multidrug efflux system)